MVLGDFEESLVNSNFIMTCGPAYTVVWLPWVTFFTHWTADSSIGRPSIMADNMRHSPSNSVGGALSETAGAALLDLRVFVFAATGASPRVSVSNANPSPRFEAKRDGRTVPRVARQIFHVSPPSL